MHLRLVSTAFLLSLVAACSSGPAAPGYTGSVLPAAAPPATGTLDLAQPADAIPGPDGLFYKVLKEGTGNDHPREVDSVSVNYTLWTPDGTKVDSSCDPTGLCTPASFPLNHVIRGWREGLPLMVVGEKIRLWVPSEMAYGDHPTRAGAPAGPLVFDIELLGISHS